MAAVKALRLWGRRSKSSSPTCPTAQTRFPNRGRQADQPQRICGRCGSRESTDSTGTSPAPSAPDEVTGDRKTNGSAPRPSRREAEPQRRFPAWFAALSRHTGVSRDQPLGPSRVQRREVERSATSPGVGHGWRPLAQAGTAQRGEWPRSAASSGGRGARGGTPGRGLALPGLAGEWAKKRCPNAQLAQRRSLSRAAALPAPGPMTGREQLPTRFVGPTGNLAGQFTTESTPYGRQGSNHG